jgi:hypothetical protein
MNDISSKLRQIAQDRGITALYHFTPLPNLESILRNGLVSRRILDTHNAPYHYTDSWRLDGQADAVSLSIHSINQSMLASKLKDARHPFIILEIDPSVIWTHHCRFCWVNAASSEIVNHRGRIDGPWAFKTMFDDFPVSTMDQRSRRTLYDIPRKRPTMMDAEIQVLDPISPELIRDITISNERHRRAVLAAMTAAGRCLPVVATDFT